MVKRYSLDDDFELQVEKLIGDALVPGRVMHSHALQKGMFHFSRMIFLPEGTNEPDPSTVVKDDLALPWQGLSELDADHGMSVTYGILIDAGFVSLRSEKPTAEISAEIRSKVGDTIWLRVEEHLDRLGSEMDENGHRRIFLIACWADLFEKPFSDLWLAAMAQHAYYVLEDDFAFGYLTALIDQRTHNERDYLRGKKSLDSSRAGGAVRAARVRPETQSRLAKMRSLMASGHTCSRAAELAHKAGYGPSASANRKLWARHGAGARDA